MPSCLTWQISQTIVNFFFKVDYTCVLNQSCGHWLFSNALHFTISMNLKLMEENQVLPSFENLMDDDSIVNDELFLLASNFRKEVINVLDFFLSLLKVYDKRKAHDMISLMLDPRYKGLRIVSSFVGRNKVLFLLIGKPYILCWSNVTTSIYILW